MSPLAPENATDASDNTVIVGAGVAGTPVGGIVSVQGVANGTEVPISAAALPLPSGAATAANLTGGAQKTQIVDGTGAVIGPATALAGVNFLPVKEPLDIQSSTVNITTQDVGSVTAVGFANQSTIIGTPTAGSAASFATNSSETTMVTIRGIWTGTLAIEVSTDGGTTWVPRGIHVAGTNIFSASITANVVGDLNTSAKTNVRVRATAPITGTATVQMVMSSNPSNVYVANAVKVLDGTTLSTTQLNIKAASTAAVATDTSAVVALSPNTPLPTGTNNVGSITNVTGTVSLPTGAATAALQTAGNASLASIDSDIDVTLSTRASAANQTNGTQKTQVTDGTNTAAVKAASTAAVATDPALVVAISPNNSIAALVTKTPLTGSSPTAATVGITSAQAVAANASRKGLVLVNTSINTISFGIGATAVLNSGITLYPGGTWVMDEYNFSTGAINAIASAASSNLSVQEFT